MIRNDLLPVLKKLYPRLGATWNEEVNLFGIRFEEDQDKDVFNDFIGIAAGENVYLFPGTTDPGLAWTQNPLTVEGVTGAAHLCLGWHPGIWIVGVHAQGTAFAHTALCQYGGPVRIWRDTDKDFVQGANDPVQTGYFGINCHRAGWTGQPTIGLYSAGCQVVRDKEDHDKMMELIMMSSSYNRNPAAARFGYMLFDKSQIEVSHG